jgi:hypothetical protein
MSDAVYVAPLNTTVPELAIRIRAAVTGVLLYLLNNL